MVALSLSAIVVEVVAVTSATAIFDIYTYTCPYTLLFDNIYYMCIT